MNSFQTTSEFTVTPPFQGPGGFCCTDHFVITKSFGPKLVRWGRAHLTK